MENLDAFTVLTELTINIQKISESITELINNDENLALVKEKYESYTKRIEKYNEFYIHLSPIPPQVQKKLDLIADENTQFEQLVAAYTQETVPSQVVTLKDISARASSASSMSHATTIISTNASRREEKLNKAKADSIARQQNSKKRREFRLAGLQEEQKH